MRFQTYRLLSIYRKCRQFCQIRQNFPAQKRLGNQRDNSQKLLIWSRFSCPGGGWVIKGIIPKKMANFQALSPEIKHHTSPTAELGLVLKKVFYFLAKALRLCLLCSMKNFSLKNTFTPYSFLLLSAIAWRFSRRPLPSLFPKTP